MSDYISKQTRLIDGNLLMEHLAEEKEVYDGKNAFDRGVKYIVEKYTHVINLHTYDIPSDQGEVECRKCKGTGCCHFHGFADITTPCADCNGTGKEEPT